MANTSHSSNAANWVDMLRLKYSYEILSLVLFGVIAAFSTQFYGILNMASISNVVMQKKASLIRRVAFPVSFILGIFCCIGIWFPTADSTDPFGNVIAYISEIARLQGAWPVVLMSLAMLGMTAIMISTLEALIIHLSTFAYDNILKMDSSSKIRNALKIANIRKGIFLLFGVALIISGVFSYVSAPLFYLLLTIAGSMIIVAPLNALAIKLLSDGKSLEVISNGFLNCYTLFFMISVIISVLFFFMYQNWLGWVGVRGGPH